MLCGLITTKYVALIIGPEGMAYVGQFTNLVTVVMLVATGACVTGVVKYIAEYKDPEKQRTLLANAFLLAGICLTVTAIAVMCFSNLLSEKTMKTDSFRDVFFIYGLLLFFPTFNTIVSAALNGLQQIRIMAIANITTACLNVLLIIAGVKFLGIKGVLLANIGSSFVVFFLYWYLFRKKLPLHGHSVIKLYKPGSVKLLLGYSAMTIVSGFLVPGIQLFVRTKLLRNYDAHTAGLWQANTRLSDYYLNFIYTVLSVYYLPRLSELTDTNALKKEIRLTYARVLPAVIVITLCIWFFRDLIIKVFLTTQFTGMLVLLKWQLIGDVIKIASWMLAYILVAKAMKKLFIGMELTFSTMFVFMNFWFINHFGLMGTVYAFTLNYVLYLLTLLILLRKFIF